MKIRFHAQSLVELAVFGSVLLFLIGSIASSYLSGSFQQNAQMYAMRKALLASYQSSRNDSATRMSGSFQIFEDRLTGDFGKFGTIDRQPVAASGGGMLSVQAMRPKDWSLDEGIALMDVVINGKAFVFSANAWVRYAIFMKATPPADLQIDNIYEASPDAVQIIKLRLWTAQDIEGRTAELRCLTGEVCSVEGNTCYAGGTMPWGSCQMMEPPDIVTIEAVRRCLADPDSTPTGVAVDCNAGTDEQRRRLYFEWVGSRRACHDGWNEWCQNLPPFYTRVTADSTTPPFSAPLDGGADSWAADKAWDYNRDGIFTDNMPPGDRPSSMWRWDLTYAAYGTNLTSSDEDSYPPYDINADLEEETLYGFVDQTVAQCQLPNDCFCLGSDPACTGAAYVALVLDSQAGDVNPSKGPKDFSDPNEAPGLRSDLKIFGRTTCVATDGYYGNDCENEDVMTYLDVKDGKAHSLDGKQLSISEAKKNQFDIVERIYQLNPNMTDMQAFKDRNNASIEVTCTDAFPLPLTPENRKPEYSCCRTVTANTGQTCFDETTKTLFIRSRLSDKRGHKWLTDVTQNWKQSLGAQ